MLWNGFVVYYSGTSLPCRTTKTKSFSGQRFSIPFVIEVEEEYDISPHVQRRMFLLPLTDTCKAEMDVDWLLELDKATTFFHLCVSISNERTAEPRSD